MRYLFALLFSAILFWPAAYAAAQTAPRSPLDDPTAQATGTTKKKSKKASATDLARMQRRMSMNPDEVKRDQQMEILEARSGGTANTSFSRGTGPARQYDKASGGFTLKKFKDKRKGTAKQKRGQSRPAMGIDPKGKPLKHKKKKYFLFF